MTSKKPGSEGQMELFGVRLEDLLNSSHPLFELAERIEWQRFEIKFGMHFADHGGRPSLSTRLIVGLEYLKYMMNESDESVVAKFVENPYWQYFCASNISRIDCRAIPHRWSNGEIESALRGARQC